MDFARGAIMTLSSLTSRAQAQPPSGTWKGKMTNDNHKPSATGGGSGCCQRFVWRHNHATELKPKPSESSLQAPAMSYPKDTLCDSLAPELSHHECDLSPLWSVYPEGLPKTNPKTSPKCFWRHPHARSATKSKPECNNWHCMRRAQKCKTPNAPSTGTMPETFQPQIQQPDWQLLQ